MTAPVSPSRPLSMVVMEHGTRRVLHCNVTAHPTAEWTLQQLREAFPSEHEHRFLIHDRDSVFSKALDESTRNLRLHVLKTPYRAPEANAICERLLGTLRREFLDWVIPLSEHNLRRLLQIWLALHNAGRPHMSLGPGVPDSPSGIPSVHRTRSRGAPVWFRGRSLVGSTTSTTSRCKPRADDSNICGPQRQIASTRRSDRFHRLQGSVQLGMLFV